MPPLTEGVTDVTKGSRIGDRRVTEVQSMHLADLGDEPQIAQAPPHAVVGRGGLELLPIDRAAIGDRVDEPFEQGSFSDHGPTPP